MKICNPKKLDLTMPQHLIEMRGTVTAVLSRGEVTKRSDRALDLQGEQWILAQELVKVLEPFEVATTFLSYEEMHHCPTFYPFSMAQSNFFRSQQKTLPQCSSLSRR